jgi:hypothetical protein
MTTNILSSAQQLKIASYVNDRGIAFTPAYEYYDAKAPNAQKLLLQVHIPSTDDWGWTSESAGRHKKWLSDDAELLQVASDALDTIEKAIRR